MRRTTLDDMWLILCLKSTFQMCLRVVLDDFRNLRPGDSGPWQHEAFVTFKDYERTTLSSLDIPEDELAASGHYVLARLLATNGLLTSEP